MKHLAAALFATLILCSAPLTRAVTIDFGNTNNTPFSPTETYTEDNFQFTVISGDTWAISSGFGNPPSGLEVGLGDPVGIGDTISVMQLGGGLFTFTALDFATPAPNGTSDGVDLIGLVNGIPTQIFPNLTSNTTSFQTLNPLFLAPIDELRIVGSSQGQGQLFLDNFVFNPVAAAVPEAGTSVLLMAFALAVLLVTRLGAIKR